ncbi:hypothetical protein AB833_26750 [Chromatiales bacterium (ex Bugula neritina AB1)]|nr:hypothetical protein AB833_26750 [Chromatiales bacterium (ex Bugula neritina AB1)]
MSSGSIPTVYVQWETFLHWLLDRTEGFPKRLRFTLTSRIDNRALDVFERLVEARYSRDKINLLSAINRDLEILRLLLRIAHDRRALDHRAFDHATVQIDTTGRMIGGWLRQQRQRSNTR